MRQQLQEGASRINTFKSEVNNNKHEGSDKGDDTRDRGHLHSHPGFLSNQDENCFFQGKGSPRWVVGLEDWVGPALESLLSHLESERCHVCDH